MQPSPSEGEAARLAALRAYQILDTPPEAEFDDIARLAAKVCGTPIALISLVDESRQWFKATYGLNTRSTARDVAFCAHAIAEPGVLVVNDALADPRFAANPLVTGEPGIRFYAGAPLTTPEGHRLGTVCVIDRVPRSLDEDQLRALGALSRQTVDELELRRARQHLLDAGVHSKSVERELRASEELKTRLIESSPDCIKVLDLDAHLLSMNAGGMAMLEICDLAPMLGSYWVDFWKGVDRDAALAAIETARQGGVGRFVGMFHTVETHRPLWFDVVVNAITDADGKPEKLLAVSRDITERKRSEDLLRALTEGTSEVVGEDFFRSLVEHLAAGLGVRYAFVAECRPDNRACTLAFWRDGKIGDNVEYDLTGTPCAAVLAGQTCFQSSNLQELFPTDTALVELEAESYLGVPLLDTAQRIIGHLVVMDDHVMRDDPLGRSVIKTFAARAGVELEREKAHQALQQAYDEISALKARLQAENLYLKEEISSQHNLSEIVGNSAEVDELLASIARVAPTDVTVLITGETGTGKELVARALHESSRRSERPLVKVNCAAISAGLVESELFGHIKGAFTGALASREGRFKLADRGTIFLDEVGELPLETQVKLLRVLQERELEPVGSNKTMRVDVRIIAATNRDLEGAVHDGRFRADLYYRLNVVEIRVPALRERTDDIGLLAHFFVEKFARKLGRPVPRIPESAIARLVAYRWPGNVRELQNVIERAVVLTRGDTLDIEGVGLPAAPTAAAATRAHEPRPVGPAPHEPMSAAAPDSTDSLADITRRHIETVLDQTGWIIEGATGAAAALNMQPSTLRSRMKKLGIVRPRT